MINYKGTPLFGKDSSVQHTSEFFAIAGTILFWLIFLIFTFVIKPQPKKKYKEVQIVLSNTPVVQKTEEAPAPAEQAAPAAASAPEEPVVEKVVETPKPAPAPKPKVEQNQTKIQAKSVSEKKQASSPQMTEQVLYKSNEELMEEQLNRKNTEDKMKYFDSMFEDNESDENLPEKQDVIIPNEVPNYSGVAGESTQKGEKITSENSNNNTQGQTASDETSRNLNKVKNARFSGSQYSIEQTESSKKTSSSGKEKNEINWSNGHARALIKPTTNEIFLTDAAQATIDVSKKISISFKVLEAGNVIEISITPESILTSIVREEIKNQISQWLFEAADYTATASFEYKIIKQ